MLRPRNQLHATPIPGTERATVPFFSPDGNRVGYILDGNTALKVVTLTGAPPVTVADSGLGADGATWSSDGNLYYDGLTAGGTVGLMRVSAAGGPAGHHGGHRARRGGPLLAVASRQARHLFTIQHRNIARRARSRCWTPVLNITPGAGAHRQVRRAATFVTATGTLRRCRSTSSGRR
jgi:hypothetical protein